MRPAHNSASKHSRVHVGTCIGRWYISTCRAHTYLRITCAPPPAGTVSRVESTYDMLYSTRKTKVPRKKRKGKKNTLQTTGKRGHGLSHIHMYDMYISTHTHGSGAWAVFILFSLGFWPRDRYPLSNHNYHWRGAGGGDARRRSSRAVANLAAPPQQWTAVGNSHLPADYAHTYLCIYRHMYV